MHKCNATCTKIDTFAYRPPSSNANYAEFEVHAVMIKYVGSMLWGTVKDQLTISY